MTQQQYIIGRKLNVLELGSTLGNISEACRWLGVSRQHYYDIKKTVEEVGLTGLLEKRRQMPRVGNPVALEIEQQLLDYSLQYPTHGQARIANELKKLGIVINSGGVRSDWLRHGLELKSLRLKRLEQWAAENTAVLTESQLQAARTQPGRTPAGSSGSSGSVVKSQTTGRPLVNAFSVQSN